MIHLLPGLGADRRIYGPAWRGLPGVRLLCWPCYRGERTLGEVAERVVAEGGVESKDVVGGTSLGGMVALEVARRLGNPRVVLIASALEPKEISRLLLRLAPLTRAAPIRLVQTLAGLTSIPVAEMFAEADPDFVRAMCLALPNWPGRTDLRDRTLRIHGSRDRIIPCPPGCRVVDGGGHLIARTYPEECVAIVAAELDRV